MEKRLWLSWSYVHLSGPKTEIELFLNSFQFGDTRKPQRFEDGQAEWATMTKLLVGKNGYFSAK